jgi:uncharacterized RDD family membrane protein YckC
MVMSPEGLPLAMELASLGARLSAFFADMLIIGFSVLAVYLLFFSSRVFFFDIALSLSRLFSFCAFNFYFIYFELAWRGRTPGKALAGIRVVSRGGGELSPASIVARNLTRLLELVIPLMFITAMGQGFFSQDFSALCFAWIIAGTLLPFLSRDRLRLGDLIGGTLVISMPKRLLAPDLARAQDDGPKAAFSFSPEQLAVYGYHELQALEDILRRAEGLPIPKGSPIPGLGVAAARIRERVGYEGEIPPGLERRFLIDFYAAQRAGLERAILFGFQKWNQYLSLISTSALAAGQRPEPIRVPPPMEAPAAAPSPEPAGTDASEAQAR